MIITAQQSSRHFPLHNIVIIPFTIVLILWYFSIATQFPERAFYTFFLAYFCIFFWGTKKASEVIIEENKKGTYNSEHQQHMSTWAITFQSLFSSTRYSWYSGLTCLGMYALYAMYSPNLMLVNIFVLILLGIFTHATTILLSLQLPFQARQESLNNSFLYFFAGMLISGSITLAYAYVYKISNGIIFWYGHSFNQSHFAIVSLALFSGWSVLGVQRAFSKVLQHKNITWAWGVFNIFCIAYFPGFIIFDTKKIVNSDIVHAYANSPYFTAFLIAYLLTYVSLLADELSMSQYRQLVHFIQGRNIKKSLQFLPWWLFSFCLTLMIAFIASAHLTSKMAIFTACLFLLRDILLIHFINFAQHPLKVFGICLLYFFILYVMIPLMFNAFGFVELVCLFWPSLGANITLTLCSISLQMALLSGLCWLYQRTKH